MTEAIIHYNYGANKDKAVKHFQIPPAKDLVQLAIIVGAFSVINGILVKKLA